MAEEERKEESPQTGEGAAEPQKQEEGPGERREDREPSPPPELAKVDLGKRAIAAYIDIAITIVLCIIPFIGWLIGVTYIALRDGFTLEPFVGQSLGKKLLNLRTVVAETGLPCDYVLSVKRNLIFIIPAASMVFKGWHVGMILGTMLWGVAIVLESLLIVIDEKGERVGDKIASTRVVEIES